MNYLGMDDFTSSYLESALWSSIDDNGTPLDAPKYSDMELADETVTIFKADCAKFQSDNAELLTPAREYQSTSHIAHDFWLTRNGHGSGFWDGDYPKELGKALTRPAKRLASVPCILAMMAGYTYRHDGSPGLGRC